jgi:hypothetical protein
MIRSNEPDFENGESRETTRIATKNRRTLMANGWKFALVVAVAATFCRLDGVLAQNEVLSQSHKDAVADLVAPEKGVREAARTKLFLDYRTMTETLRGNLEKAIRDNGKDRAWRSPLHCSILAAESWRAFETEGLLLSVLDYEIDTRTIPEGTDIGGSAFYPAAAALVTLRFDPRKAMVGLLGAEETPRRIQLLTWILEQRVGAAEGKRMLNAEMGILSTDKQRANFSKALQLLEKPEDLLTLPRG